MSVQLHCFACGSPLFLTQLIEETAVAFSLGGLGILFLKFNSFILIVG